MDKGKDSVISVSDISRTLHGMLGEILPSEDIDEMIFRFNYGKNDAITFEDYISVMKNKRNQRLNENEVNADYQACARNRKGLATKEIRWRNEENMNIVINFCEYSE